MAEAYIQVKLNILIHPKLELLSEILGGDPLTVFGAIVHLWVWCGNYATDGDLSHLTHAAIARAAGWKKDPDRFVQALIDAKGPSGYGFVDLVNGKALLHDWPDHAAGLIDSRALTKARNTQNQRNRRERIKNAMAVTDGHNVVTTSNGDSHSDESDTGDVSDSDNSVTVSHSDMQRRHHMTGPDRTGPDRNMTGPERTTVGDNARFEAPLVGPRPPSMSIKEYLRRSQKALEETHGEGTTKEVDTPPVSALPPLENDPGEDPAMRELAAAAARRRTTNGSPIPDDAKLGRLGFPIVEPPSFSANAPPDDYHRPVPLPPVPEPKSPRTPKESP